jgi:hypothetical protein
MRKAVFHLFGCLLMICDATRAGPVRGQSSEKMWELPAFFSFTNCPTG